MPFSKETICGIAPIWSAALFRRFGFLFLQRKKESGGKSPHSKEGKQGSEDKMAKQKLTARSAAWLEVLSGIETTIEKALRQVAEHEANFTPTACEDPSYAGLSRFSERWQGLWLRTAQAEKELGGAELALVDVEKNLRAGLDEVVACRQNLAQWLGRAVG